MCVFVRVLGKGGSGEEERGCILLADTIQPGQSKNGYLILESQESGNFSIREARCLISPNLVLKAPGFPGELLVFSLCWNPGEVGSHISEEMQQQPWDRWIYQGE